MKKREKVTDNPTENNGSENNSPEKNSSEKAASENSGAGNAGFSGSDGEIAGTETLATVDMANERVASERKAPEKRIRKLNELGNIISGRDVLKILLRDLCSDPSLFFELLKKTGKGSEAKKRHASAAADDLLDIISPDPRKIQDVLDLWTLKAIDIPLKGKDCLKETFFSQILFIYHDLISLDKETRLVTLEQLKRSAEQPQKDPEPLMKAARLDYVALRRIKNILSFPSLEIHLLLKENIEKINEILRKISEQPPTESELIEYVRLSREFDFSEEIRQAAAKDAAERLVFVKNSTKFELSCFNDEFLTKRGVPFLEELNRSRGAFTAEIDLRLNRILAGAGLIPRVSRVFESLTSFASGSDKERVAGIVEKLRGMKEISVVQKEIPEVFRVVKILMSPKPLKKAISDPPSGLSSKFLKSLVNGDFDEAAAPAERYKKLILKGNPAELEITKRQEAPSPAAAGGAAGFKNGKAGGVAAVGFPKSQPAEKKKADEVKKIKFHSDKKEKKRYTAEIYDYNDEEKKTLDKFNETFRKLREILSDHTEDKLNLQPGESLKLAYLKEKIKIIKSCKNKLIDLYEAVMDIDNFVFNSDLSEMNNATDGIVDMAEHIITESENEVKFKQKILAKLKSDPASAKKGSGHGAGKKREASRDDDKELEEMMGELVNRKVSMKFDFSPKELFFDDHFFSSKEASSRVIASIETSSAEVLSRYIYDIRNHLEAFFHKTILECSGLEEARNIKVPPAPFFHAVIMGAINFKAKQGDYRFLHWLTSGMTPMNFFLPDFFKALHLGVNFTPVSDSLYENFQNIIHSWKNRDDMVFSDSQIVKSFFIKAVVKAVVKAPSRVLCDFLTYYADKYNDDFHVAAEIMEEYLEAVEGKEFDERLAIKKYYFNNNIDLFLNSLQKIIADFLNYEKSYNTYSKEGNQVWRRLLDAENGLVGSVLAECLNDADVVSLKAKIDALRDLESVTRFIEEAHRRENGEESLKLSVITITNIRSRIMYLAEYAAQYVELLGLVDHEAGSRKTEAFDRYHSQLLKMAEAAIDATDFDSLNIYTIFYKKIQNLIINPLEKIELRDDPLEPWKVFYPWEIDLDLNSYLILFPETRELHRSFSISPQDCLFSIGQETSVDKGFISYINEERTQIPNIFLRIHPSFKGLVPSGASKSYAELLDDAVVEIAEKLRNNLDEYIEFVEKIYVTAELASPQDFRKIKLCFHLIDVHKRLVDEAASLKSVESVAELKRNITVIKNTLMNFKYQPHPFSNGAYFTPKLNFYRILENNQKKLDQQIFTKQKTSSKKQDKTVLRRFWELLKTPDDFYKLNKDLSLLKAFFLEFDYNLIDKADPRLKTSESGVIFKIIDAKLKLLNSYDQTSLYYRPGFDNHIIILFIDEKASPEDLAGMIKEETLNQKDTPVTVISFKPLDYNFRLRLVALAHEEALDFILIDPYFTAYLLLPELGRERKEAFHYVGKIYGGFDPYRLKTSDDSLGFEIEHYYKINKSFELDFKNSTLIASESDIDLKAMVERLFRRLNEAINDVRHVFRDVKNDKSFLKALREEFGKLGITLNGPDHDLPLELKNIFNSHASPYKTVIILFYDSDDLLKEWRDDDLFELIVISRIMEACPDNIRVHFHGEKYIYRLAQHTGSNKLQCVPLIKGLMLNRFTASEPIVSRRLLLWTLKAVGVVFPETYSIPDLLKRFNYDINLVFSFTSELLSSVRKRSDAALLSPYEVEPELVEEIMKEGRYEERAVEIYLECFKLNPCYRYIIYTIAYMILSLHVHVPGISSKLLYLQLLELFPEKFDYIDMDEINTYVIELMTMDMINFTFGPDTYQNPYISGQSRFVELLGGYDRIVAEIIGMRSDKSKFRADPFTFNRKRVLKPLSKFKLPPNPPYYSLKASESDPEEFNGIHDYHRFETEYKKCENSPSPFTCSEELEFSRFDAKISFLLINPLTGGPLTEPAFVQTCLMRGFVCVKADISAIFVTKDDAIECDFDRADSLFSSMSEFIEERATETTSKTLFFFDFTDIERFPGICIADFIDFLDELQFDNEFQLSFIVMLSPDTYVSALVEVPMVVKRVYSFSPSKWSKTTLSVYLSELGLAPELTAGVLEKTGGYYDLVVSEIRSHAGGKFKINPNISRPMLSWHLPPYQRIILNCFKGRRSLTIDDLVKLFQKEHIALCLDSCSRDTAKDVIAAFAQFRVLESGMRLTQGREHAIVTINPLFASGKVFPFKS
ncbi:MAG: hypothetical protein LBR53_13080 [Deltaproteobacteria bacterium]|jgi:hypothetical protein|nr:hypothetical protein [Deltaproteobacteria bacterium]